MMNPAITDPVTTGRVGTIGPAGRSISAPKRKPSGLLLRITTRQRERSLTVPNPPRPLASRPAHSGCIYVISGGPTWFAGRALFRGPLLRGGRQRREREREAESR